MLLVLLSEGLLVISIRILTALTDSNKNVYLQPVMTAYVLPYSLSYPIELQNAVNCHYNVYSKL